MPFSTKAVANEFLTIARKAGKDLTPMKLQKLVYFAHGWFLAVTGKPLISERVQAWQYGPVIQSLYKEFKEYGNEPIITPAAIESGWDGERTRVFVYSLDNSGLKEEEINEARQVIQKVWDLYGGFSAARLSNATHVDGGPWQQVYKEGHRSIEIPDDKIRGYFQGLAHVSAR
jgi:uncharacterized phage-associated protein